MQNRGRDAEYRPPLPPRSPRPSLPASHSGDYRLTSFPPPPGPPPRSSGPSPIHSEGPPPALPPRPTGFGSASTHGDGSGRSASWSSLGPPWNNNTGRPTTLMSFPPPPLSPNRPQSSYGDKPPPLPPRRPVARPAEVEATPPSTVPSTAASSPLFPSASSLQPPSSQSPLNLTSFPPPPSGPPPQIPTPSAAPTRTSLSPEPSTSNTSLPNISPHDSNVHSVTSSSGSLETSTPGEVPPPYTPLAAIEPSTSPVPTPPAAAAGSPPPEGTPVSNPQSPNELSFFPMPPIKTPTRSDEHIEELLDQMMGPAIELTDTDLDPVSSPVPGDEPLRVRPLSRQSFIDSEPEASSTPIAPLKPPKTPLNSQRPASVSLSSSGPPQMSSFAEPEFANPPGQHAEADSFSRAGNDKTPEPYKTAPSSPVADTTTATDTTATDTTATDTTATDTSPAPYELYGHEFYYPFPSHDHGVSPDQDGQPDQAKASSSPGASRPVATCIDTPVTFETTWYTHFAAPEFFVCSRCYADHIATSQFRDAFTVAAPAEDGAPRACRFSSPRMKDDLWQKAVASDYLQPVTDWMQHRSRVADCKGFAAGAKGKEGVKWYTPKLHQFPSWFVVCEACYEDRVKVFPQMVSYFRPHPDAQRPEEVWNCDFSIPFVWKEFEKQGPKGDWSTFVREARARLEIPACPGQDTAYAYGRPWFRPVHGPDWLLLCAACFLDRVFHTTDAGKWAPDEQLSATERQQVRCPMAQFNISTAMSRAEELKDFTVFWAAMNKLSQERFCDPAGIKDGVWYTLHGVGADAGYQVCSSCYASVAETLGVSQFFRRKINIPPGAVLPCCMNPVHPRGRDFYTRLLEMYYTQSPAALAAYADEYAAIPPCPRYEAAGTNNKGRRWYGWKECTVCPECHHEFARKHEALAGLMTLKNDLVEKEGDDGEEGVVCEMYSPRMRDLYILCNGTEQAAADPKPLLEFAAERRRVFAETYLRVCKMNPGERMAEAEQVRELQQRWRGVE